MNSEKLPDTQEELIASLSAGYLARVQLPPDAPAPVIAVADEYPRLRSLAIELSGARIKPDYRPSTFRAMGRMHVHRGQVPRPDLPRF